MKYYCVAAILGAAVSLQLPHYIEIYYAYSTDLWRIDALTRSLLDSTDDVLRGRDSSPVGWWTVLVLTVAPYALFLASVVVMLMHVARRRRNIDAWLRVLGLSMVGLSLVRFFARGYLATEVFRPGWRVTAEEIHFQLFKSLPASLEKLGCVMLVSLLPLCGAFFISPRADGDSPASGSSVQAFLMRMLPTLLLGYCLFALCQTMSDIVAHALAIRRDLPNLSAFHELRSDLLFATWGVAFVTAMAILWTCTTYVKKDNRQ